MADDSLGSEVIKELSRLTLERREKLLSDRAASKASPGDPAPQE